MALELRATNEAGAVHCHPAVVEQRTIHSGTRAKFCVHLHKLESNCPQLRTPSSTA